MSEQQAWLDQVREEILDPARPICDPHHHLWDRPGTRYLAEELLADTGSGHNVVSTVFVECLSMYREDGPEELRPVGETEFVERVAAKSAAGESGPTQLCAGIVGYADLTLGDGVQAVLDAHMAASPRFRGIRHASGWDASDDVRNSHSNPPQGLLGMESFRRGFAHLAPRGLIFEAWLYHPQIPELTALARQFPETRILLDHFGGPLGIGPYEDRADDVFAAWKPAVAELATCPNVYAKLGGINMPINGFGWHRRDRPATSDELVAATGHYYDFTIQHFGPERCMFESNFPVDRASVSYAALWNAFKKMAAGYPDAEMNALFHDTAARFYRL